MHKRLLVLMLLIAAGLPAGCKTAGYLAYLFAPGQRKRTIKPKFDGFPRKTVAVVIFARPEVLFDYPDATLELSLLIADELRKNVKDIKIVDPAHIVAFQNANIYWDSMDKTTLAARFETDYILQVSLVEFTTREPGTVSLFRGQIWGEWVVYDGSKPEHQAEVYRGEDIRVRHPSKGPVGELAESEVRIRAEAERLFADALAKKFYKHKGYAPK